MESKYVWCAEGVHSGIVRSRAPLRLGLAGGGTDVSPYCDLHGGAVLNVTISLYAHTTISRSADGQVRFIALDQKVEEAFPLMTEIPAEAKLGLHRGVYNYVVRTYGGGVPLPLTITTYCDAPAGSGLGSSSALVVSMVNAFAELLGLPMGEYDLASTAYQIERVEVGLHGGKQDQYAAAFGGFNFMEFHSDERVLVNPLRVKEWVISELESSLVLFFTGKSRSSAAIIEEESRNVRENNQAAIEAMHRTKDEAFRLKECLLRGNIPAMGEVMREAWVHKKRMAASISNPTLDGLYDLAIAEGAFCGKVSGAGGGGFMMFLGDPRRKLCIAEALTKSCEGSVIDAHMVLSGAQSWRAH